MEWKRNRKRFFSCISIFFIAVCVFLASTVATECLATRRPFSGKADLHFQTNEEDRKEKGLVSGKEEGSWSMARRFLGGLGSFPPRCASKCGKCTPCKPVHVPVPPGTPVTAEYYPEAWRCKCGNRLYMP